MKAKEWKVCFPKAKAGEAGAEIRINKPFHWAKEQWILASVYRCAEGLVLDFCVETEKERLQAFIAKWDLLNEVSHHYSQEQREQIEQEHPLIQQFRVELKLNGQTLKQSGSSMDSWIPLSCLDGKNYPIAAAKRWLEHYQLDGEKGWSFHRCWVPFPEEGKAAGEMLDIRLIRDLVYVAGAVFALPQQGGAMEFCDPVSGRQHRLTVLQIDRGELPLDVSMEEIELPRQYLTMTYTLEPELRGLTVRDTCPADEPRSKSGGRVRRVHAGTVFARPREDGSGRKMWAAASNLRFEAVESVNWQLLFRKKPMEDVLLSVNLSEKL